MIYFSKTQSKLCQQEGSNSRKFETKNQYQTLYFATLQFFSMQSIVTNGWIAHFEKRQNELWVNATKLSIYLNVSYFDICQYKILWSSHICTDGPSASFTCSQYIFYRLLMVLFSNQQSTCIRQYGTRGSRRLLSSLPA